MKRIPSRLQQIAIALLVCAVALASAGCRSAKPIQFGFYAVPEADLKKAKALGADFVVGPGDPIYLEAAKAAGIKVIATGLQYPRGRAVMGHYIWDEPDLHIVAPARVRERYRAAKKASQKPVFLNLSSGFSIEAYADQADALMFDWYPIGWQPIETYLAHLRAARLASGRKPFFAVIQAFDWTQFPESMPSNANHRLPTRTEIKAMSAWSAMSGAAGIVYYPFADKKIAENSKQEMHAAIKESIEFIHLYDPFFTSPRAWGPYPFRFVNRTDSTNATFSTSIAIRYSRLDKKSPILGLAAANTTDRRIEVTAAKGVEMDVASSLTFEPYEVKFLLVRIHDPNAPSAKSGKAP